MSQVQISKGKYTYSHNGRVDVQETIDIHDIHLTKSRARACLAQFAAIVFFANVFYLIMMKDKLAVSLLWRALLGLLLAKLLQYKPVQKESVVIMPGFGVQIETHFWNGKVSRHFFPIAQILRPVLNECVTPVICYWSLVLILDGEEELALVFQFTTSGHTQLRGNAIMITSTITVVLFSTMVFGLATKPLVNHLLPPGQKHLYSNPSEPTSPVSLYHPLLEYSDIDGAPTGPINRPSSLRMLLTKPTHTVHFYWRKFDNGFMRPLFGGRGFTPFAPGSPIERSVHGGVDDGNATK